MRFVFLLATIALLSFPAWAIENVEPTRLSDNTGGYCWKWEGITVDEISYISDLTSWRGGSGSIFVSGLSGDASMEVTLGYSSGGTYSVDSDSAPDGFTFSATTKSAVDFTWALPAIGIDFSSGDLYQDVDVTVCEIREMSRNR